MDLGDWRRQIDAIDQQLVELLNRRCQCALEIGHLKHSLRRPVCEPSRESVVVENVRRANRGPLSEAALQRLFECIIAEMRQVQEQELVKTSSNPR